jgi:3-isopropylmalate/(R)-2-methylmalate dehydratase small subunit
VDAFRRHCLLQGLDEIGLTLQYEADIQAYERRRQATHPWLFREQLASAEDDDE